MSRVRVPAGQHVLPARSVQDVQDDLLQQLGAMDPGPRERACRGLVDRQFLGRVRRMREEAVRDLLDRPGATWQSVAEEQGLGMSTINKLVSALSARLRAEAAQLAAGGRRGRR